MLTYIFIHLFTFVVNRAELFQAIYIYIFLNFRIDKRYSLFKSLEFKSPFKMAGKEGGGAEGGREGGRNPV